MLLGTVISGMIKWGRITGEVLWGWETQLFQTRSYQLLFFCREEKKKWPAQTPLRACTTRVGVFGEGGWDEVTMRLPLYSLHSAGILFTPELLCFGLCCKCAVQTTPDKCSVWLPTAQTVTPSSIFTRKRYYYSIIFPFLWLIAVTTDVCFWMREAKFSTKPKQACR